MAREDFAVRGMMPEMDPYEVSPLAVQGPVVSQPDLSQFDLSQFQNFNPLDGANFSGAFGGSGSPVSPQGVPTSYAFPENYGNPKNKIYNLTANPDDSIRLKLVDGTTIYEGQGPEAAAKAAAMVQQLGKDFGTQSTWILDKQTAGGDWKQVSQDTVGEKKKTALNSFLDVVAPIAGAALAFVPGIGPVLSGMAGGLGSAGAAAIGAAGGSLLNSGLQNQNSAEAFKKAALAAGTTFIGAKIAPNVTSAFKGLTGGTAAATPVGTLAGNAVEKSLAAAAEQAAARAALSQGIATTVVPMVAKQGLTSAITTGLGAGLSGLVRPDFNPTLDTTVPNQDLVAKPNEVTTQNDAELVVRGTRLAPGFDPSIAGAGLGAGLGGVVQPAAPPVKPTIDPIDELVVTAKPKVDVGALTGAAVQVPVTTPAPNPTIEELVVTAKKKPQPEKPLVPTPVILPDGTLNPDFVNKDFTVDSPEGTTDTKPEPKTPLGVIKDVLPLVPLIGGLGGAGSGGGSGGSGTNTLTYPGGNQPGTPGSLGGVFTSKLPTRDPALAVTPRDMGQRDWLRYGFGPEASFFSNVPDRQALAVQKPTIAAMPALAEKLSEPAPNLMVKPDTQTAGVPVDGTMLNGDPSIVWNGGVNGGWMQTERGMPPPEEIATQAAFARGGSTGGTSRKPRTEFAVHGAGTGRSDDIPAVLSDGEYVMDAETVALLGDGSSKAGAEKLDQLRVNLRRHKGANLAKGRFSVNAKSPEKYLTGGRV